MPEPRRPFRRVRRAFDRDALKRVCEMHETGFAPVYGMEVTLTEESRWAQADYPLFYAHLDRGSDILAVAHLDTVVTHRQRRCEFIDTAGGPVVYSGALDDRLGAYTILELLPKLGINVDVLLTTGEEDGCSTAEHFAPPEGKDYRWMIEFDRGGSDVVMYQYDDFETSWLVEESGARVGNGSFSDIAYLEHLGIKGFNWGVAYRDYHSVRGHAYLEEYWAMLAHFVRFHAANEHDHLPHIRKTRPTYGRTADSWWGDDGDWKYGDSAYAGLEDDEPPWASGESKRVEDDPAMEEEDVDLVSDDFNIVNERLLAITAGEPTLELESSEPA